jgi:hypothetical protein
MEFLEGRKNQARGTDAGVRFSGPHQMQINKNLTIYNPV